MNGFYEKLSELGLSLPDAPAPAANYIPYVVVGNLVFVSGQISIDAEGSLITGKVGVDLDSAAGAKAAERCALALLAQAKAACGGDRLTALGDLARATNDAATWAAYGAAALEAEDLETARGGDLVEAGRAIVEAAVAGHVVQRLFFADVAAGLANYHGDLTFVVKGGLLHRLLEIFT